MSTHETAAAPCMAWQRWAGALGFHVPMLAFALRTAVAAFAALGMAYALGLEHPHWAAMSAWASSQPMREHLLSRSIYRFSGSVVGVLYAVALVLLAQDSLWVLALGLALWGALCAFLGNLQRGYMVYGCMLAGYSAVMVGLLHHGPADTIWPFAWDRMCTVITGVLAALCISWCFAPRRKAAVLIAQSHGALAGVLQATAVRLRQHAAPEGLDNSSLIRHLAQVEELLELYPEGSRTARNTVQVMRWQQHCAMEMVYQLGQTPVPILGGAPMALAQALDALALALHAAPQAQGDKPLALPAAVRQAVAACEAVAAGCQKAGTPAPPDVNALYRLLQALRHGLQAEALDLHMGTAGALPARRLPRLPALPLHRDWVGAKEAAVRAGGSLLVFGVLWAWTGASIVGFAMLGLATMLLVFSAFESPSRTMAFVLRGQLIGAGLALLCQSLVWPLAQSATQMVWLTLPFVLIAGLVFAHKRTAAGAMDTNMAMFILLAPVFPDTAGLGQHLSYALAVVCGPALAWLVYRWVYPTNAQRRMQTVAQMMVQEVPALARRLLHASQPAPWEPQPSSLSSPWQAQLHHRLLRLVRWADKTQWPERDQLPRMAMSLRAVQSTMLQLQQWRHGTLLATPALRRTARLAELALHRTAVWGEAPPAPRTTATAQAAWQALARAGCLPPALAAQALQVGQRDLAALDAARTAFAAGLQA